MGKDKYEISIWEDYLEEPASNPSSYHKINSYFKERKIAVIGSDTMTASCRALEPKFVENMNGTHTFTFKMYYVCRDDTVQDLTSQFITSNGEVFIDSNDLFFIFGSISSYESYENPFIKYLVNERKIKVKWKGKWYDLIVKKRQEDSSGKFVTYTCVDAFMSELSKTGYDVELDTELENNQGNVTDLAQIILRDTDWIVDVEGSDTIQQYKEESVYEKTLSRPLSDVMNQTTSSIESRIPSGSKILIYYSQIQELFNSGQTSGTIDLQFAYTKDSDFKTEEGTQLVINVDCYLLEGVGWMVGYLDLNNPSDENKTIIFTNPLLETIHFAGEVSKNYHAKRLVKSQQTIFDPLTQKYCNVYTVSSNATIPSEYQNTVSSGDVIYNYNETQYREPTYVNNLIVNSKDFVSTKGWVTTSSTDHISFGLHPTYSSSDYQDITDYQPNSYLKIPSGTTVYNVGLKELSSYIPDGFTIGEKYIFRAKGYAVTGDSFTSFTNNSSSIVPAIKEYNPADYSIPSSAKEYFSIDSGFPSSDNDWLEYQLTCTRSVTRAEIFSDHVGFFITTGSTEDSWIQEVQFFPECYGTDSSNNPIRINPGDADLWSVAETKYIYYNHTKSAGVSFENLNYLWNNTTDWDVDFIEPVYNKNFEKIRSIKGKQSNYFNLLQTLAETFECWIEFDVKHKENGSLCYFGEEDDDTNTGSITSFIINDSNYGDSNNNINYTLISYVGSSSYDGSAKQLFRYGTPKKYIRFKAQIGEETGIGFVYGIDLKSIQRTTQSDQIVTKTIVPANKNEFAKDGFCTIARSIENYSRSNFILNFDYYTSNGLLDFDQITTDLYSASTGIGYYYWLNKWNLEYDKRAELLNTRKLELSQQKSYLTIYETSIFSIQQEIDQLKAEAINIIHNLPSFSDPNIRITWETVIEYAQNHPTVDEIVSRVAAVYTLENSLNEYQTLYENVNNSIENLTNTINSYEEAQAVLLRKIEAKNFEFYRRYYHFIQEGVWKDDEYVDDNLYYLDAQSMAYKFSRPKVSYNISVLRLSSLEEFKNKVFHLGDISFIQDTEFFGYVYIDGIKTPHKEKVLVSEITSYFDEPEKDVLKIQNYKSQFADLFHRIGSLL